MIRSFEPPPRRRFRNPRLLEPAHQPLAPDAVLREFLSLRDALTRRVQQADGLDLERVIVVSPVSRFFRMPLGGYFAFLLAHDRRHLWQARQALGAGSAHRRPTRCNLQETARKGGRGAASCAPASLFGYVHALACPSVDP